MEVVKPIFETTVISIDILYMKSTVDSNSCGKINGFMSDSGFLCKGMI